MSVSVINEWPRSYVVKVKHLTCSMIASKYPLMVYSYRVSRFSMFNAAEQCEKQVGTPAWDACCGTYPTRFPYSTEGKSINLPLCDFN